MAHFSPRTPPAARGSMSGGYSPSLGPASAARGCLLLRAIFARTMAKGHGEAPRGGSRHVRHLQRRPRIRFLEMDEFSNRFHQITHFEQVHKDWKGAD